MTAGAGRYLIVNADDFGQSTGINRGVRRAHEQGVVTSASLMVRWEAAAEAAEYARARLDLGLGLHLDLGQWAFRDGDWVADYEVVDLDDEAAVADEVARQLDAFHQLAGRPPTHLDGHQHVQRSGAPRRVLRAAGRRLGIPVRSCSQVTYCGGFYGQTGTGDPYPQAISSAALLQLLDELEPGWTEIGCHPGLDDDAPAGYRTERAREVEVLCDPAVRRGVLERGILLRTFTAADPATPAP
jgi:chitin disaccharide deacetylase